MMTTITITLEQIRKHDPCDPGWRTLLRHLGKTVADDESFPLSTVLDSNGFSDALWCLRCLPEHDRLWRLYAVWCVRQVQYLMTDPHSIAALDVAERYANGDATEQELTTVRNAARNAAGDAAGAIAGDAVWDAVRNAAGDLARDAQAAKLRELLDTGSSECLYPMKEVEK